MKINGTNKDIPAGYYMPTGDFKVQAGDLLVQQEQYLAGGKPWEPALFVFGQGREWTDEGIKMYVFRPIPVPAGYELLQAPYVVQKGDMTACLSVLEGFGADARILEEASEYGRVGNTSSFMEESPVFVTFRPLKKVVEVPVAPESKLPEGFVLCTDSEHRITSYDLIRRADEKSWPWVTPVGLVGATVGYAGDFSLGIAYEVAVPAPVPAPKCELPDEVKALDEKVKALYYSDNCLYERLNAVERTVSRLQRRIEYPVAAARTGRLTTAANCGRTTDSGGPCFRVLRIGSTVQKGDFILNRRGEWVEAVRTVGEIVGEEHPTWRGFRLVAKRSI